MPRYYFDTRDGAEFVRDEIGIELDGVEAARDEATRGLADFARDALPGSIRRELAVECRAKPTATFSGPPYGLRLLCLPHELAGSGPHRCRPCKVPAHQSARALIFARMSK
jgi:uncharacterized protein DUF6894